MKKEEKEIFVADMKSRSPRTNGTAAVTLGPGLPNGMRKRVLPLAGSIETTFNRAAKMTCRAPSIVAAVGEE